MSANDDVFMLKSSRIPNLFVVLATMYAERNPDSNRTQARCVINFIQPIMPLKRRYNACVTLHVLREYRNAIPLLFLLSRTFFHERETINPSSSRLSSRIVPYNHIKVLYHVKTRSNGPCLHAPFVRVKSAMFGRALDKGAAFEGAARHAKCRHPLILHPRDRRLMGLFNLTSFP